MLLRKNSRILDFCQNGFFLIGMILYYRHLEKVIMVVYI